MTEKKRNLCKCSSFQRPVSHFSKCTTQRRDSTFVFWRRRKLLSNHPDGICETISACALGCTLRFSRVFIPEGGLCNYALLVSFRCENDAGRLSGCKMEKKITSLAKGWNLLNWCSLFISIKCSLWDGAEWRWTEHTRWPGIHSNPPSPL